MVIMTIPDTFQQVAAVSGWEQLQWETYIQERNAWENYIW